MISVLRSVLDNYTRFAAHGRSKPPQRTRKLAVLSVLGNLALALCAAPLFGQATGNTTIQPDVTIPFTLTAAGNFPVNPTNNGAGDNRTKGVSAWTLEYSNTGMTSVTVTLQSGCSPTTTVSFGTFTGVIPTSPAGNANPIVSDTGGQLQAINGTACISWVRVNVAATGTGTLTGTLYGFRNSSAAVNGAGGGGNCPQGSLGAVQLYQTSSMCAGDASVISGNLVSLNTPPAPVVTSPGDPGMSVYVYCVAAFNDFGYTICSPGGVTTTSADPPDSMNFNSVATDCGANPAGTIYAVWLQTVGSGGLIGQLGTVTCGSTFNDTSGVGDNAAFPFFNATTGIKSVQVVTSSVGFNAQSGEIGCVAIGENSFACSPGSGYVGGIAIGLNSLAQTSDGLAVGDHATAVTSNTIAIGTRATANNNGEIAIGNGAVTNSSQGDSIAIGTGASASFGTNGDLLAIGVRANAGADGTIALGTQASALVAHSFVVGGAVSTGGTISDWYGGSSDTAPHDFTIHGADVTGTDVAGSAIRIAGGQSTGAGSGGPIVFEISTAGMAGTTQNLLTEAGRFTPTGLFQLSSLSVSLPVLTNASRQLISGTLHGNTTRFQMSDNTGGSGNLAKYDANGNVTDGPSSTAPSFTTIQTTGSAFAGLGTPGNGTLSYCSDCTVTSGIDNTCVGSGSGAFAQRINGAWKCEQ